jgi:hypothetical protein
MVKKFDTILTRFFVSSLHLINIMKHGWNANTVIPLNTNAFIRRICSYFIHIFSKNKWTNFKICQAKIIFMLKKRLVNPSLWKFGEWESPCTLIPDSKWGWHSFASILPRWLLYINKKPAFFTWIVWELGPILWNFLYHLFVCGIFYCNMLKFYQIWTLLWVS